jgi:mono/diheme cytochrome c family protein
MRNPVIVACLGALLASCGTEKDERGIELMPDMYHTPAYESQDAGTIVVEGRDAQGAAQRRVVHYPSMQPPPPGTVARGTVPYPFAATDFEGARTHRNPLAVTPQVLRQGQQDFLTFCAPCHGRDGNSAHGYVAAQFSGIPSLNVARIVEIPDGEIFHVVTMGKGRMQQMRAQLPPERRWALAHFLKVQARANVSAEEAAKAASVVSYLDADTSLTDAQRAARREEILRLAAQAQADLAAIGSAGDGHEFIPPPPPVPEYVGPTWPAPPEPAK